MKRRGLRRMGEEGGNLPPQTTRNSRTRERQSTNVHASRRCSFGSYISRFPPSPDRYGAARNSGALPFSSCLPRRRPGEGGLILSKSQSVRFVTRGNAYYRVLTGQREGRGAWSIGSLKLGYDRLSFPGQWRSKNENMPPNAAICREIPPNAGLFFRGRPPSLRFRRRKALARQDGAASPAASRGFGCRRPVARPVAPGHGQPAFAALRRGKSNRFAGLPKSRLAVPKPWRRQVRLNSHEIDYQALLEMAVYS